MSCPKCGAVVASNASTCQGCGAEVRRSDSAGPSFSSQAFIQSISGPGQLQQRLTLAGGALAVLGSFLPFYVINLPQGLGAAGSFSFINTGVPGGLAVLVAIGLSVVAIMPSAPPRLNLCGLGLATLVLGMLLYATTASSFEQANPVAAALVGRGIGFYLLAIGFLLLEYVYVQRVPR